VMGICRSRRGVGPGHARGPAELQGGHRVDARVAWPAHAHGEREWLCEWGGSPTAAQVTVQSPPAVCAIVGVHPAGPVGRIDRQSDENQATTRLVANPPLQPCSIFSERLPEPLALAVLLPSVTTACPIAVAEHARPAVSARAMTGRERGGRCMGCDLTGRDRWHAGRFVS
jgi:hypothetical protein